MTIYLDNNAAAPVRPAVQAAMAAAMEVVGNPAAVHGGARAARAVIERAREQVARLVGAEPHALTFTSSGTEANNLAVFSAARSGAVKTLIVSNLEHACVRESALNAGLQVEIWPCLPTGVIDLDWLTERLSRWTEADGRLFVALTAAQNETGVIQPVADVAALVNAHGGWLHVDAVQAAGKIPVNFTALGAGTLALASHKLGGPIGVGALVASPAVTLSKLIHGGGQERGYRAGGENLTGIAGFGAAAERARDELPSYNRHALARDGFEARLKTAAPIVVFGGDVPRLANTSCIACPGIDGQAQVMRLDLAGVWVGSGSACSSGKVKSSAILEAMGAGDLATCAIRVSSGWASKGEDWDRAATLWLQAFAHAGAPA